MDIGMGHYLTVAPLRCSRWGVRHFPEPQKCYRHFMSIELMLLAVNINFVTFSAFLGDLTGQVFTMFILTVAAAEAAIGLAILVVFFRNKGSIAVEDISSMKGVGDIHGTLAVFPPLVAFLVAGSCSGNRSAIRGLRFVTCAGLIVAAIASIVLFFQCHPDNPPHVRLRWQHGLPRVIFRVEWALRIDQLAVIMMCVINIVSACVHVYSVGYMSHDEPRAASWPICRCLPSRC
jgi:NADH-quinone oxidoreductase subunit K